MKMNENSLLLNKNVLDSEKMLVEREENVGECDLEQENKVDLMAELEATSQPIKIESTGKAFIKSNIELEEIEKLIQCNGSENSTLNGGNGELEEGEIENDQSDDQKYPSVTQQKKPTSFRMHRGLDEVEENSSSSSSDSEINNSCHSDSETEQMNASSNKQLPVIKPIKTHGEFSLESLPPIEALHVTVGDDVKLLQIGAVIHCVATLVVVESEPNLPPLDADTILFLAGKKVLGQIFDTIGQVSRPCYTVRFNHESEIEERGIKSGMSVFYAPDSPDWTRYVFLAHVMKFHGSDASWEHDNEPPAQFVDYSDDEAERAAKAKQRGRDNSSNSNSCNGSNESETTAKSQKVIQISQGPGSTNRNVGRRNRKSFGNNLHNSQIQPSQSSSVCGSGRPITSWPPKFAGQRPESPGNLCRGPSFIQPQRFCPPPSLEARFPLPDMSQPPPPSGILAIPPPSFVLPHPLHPPPAFPPLNSLPWRPFQNVPPFSFSASSSTSPHPPFFSSQIPPLPCDMGQAYRPPGMGPPPSPLQPQHFQCHYPFPP